MAQQPSGGIARRSVLLAAGGVALSWAAPRAAFAATDKLGFQELYSAVTVLGLKYSDKLLSLKDRKVQMRGYMAPPLKAESNFFVLTREPMALCPFCQSDADWPADIVAVFLRRIAPVTNPSDPIEVEGRLEVGSSLDKATGFVSQVRLVEADLRVL